MIMLGCREGPGGTPTRGDIMPDPWYTDDTVSLYFGDMRDVLPRLDLPEGTVCVTDPPYGETSLRWDRWPDGWPALVAAAGIRSMWCFGSMRMFLTQRDQFTGWKLSQDVVWEKHNGSGFSRDRFKRKHEHAVHWYRGAWSGVHHQVPMVAGQARPAAAIAARAATPHTGAIRSAGYEYGTTGWPRRC